MTSAASRPFGYVRGDGINAVVADGYVEIPVQTLAFSLRMVGNNGDPIKNARVNLRKANDTYVMYARTDSDGVARFEVAPGAEIKLEVDYRGGKYLTVSTTVNTATQFDLQTVVLSVYFTLQGTDLVSQRVDLLRPDGGYVTYATTGGDGRATYEVLPGAQHRLRSTYGDVTWISDVAIGPMELEHNFD